MSSTALPLTPFSICAGLAPTSSMESRGQQVESNSFRQLADHDAMISSPCPQPALPLMTPEKLNIASTTAPVTTDRLLNSCSPGSPHAFRIFVQPCDGSLFAVSASPDESIAAFKHRLRAFCDFDVRKSTLAMHCKTMLVLFDNESMSSNGVQPDSVLHIVPSDFGTNTTHHSRKKTYSQYADAEDEPSPLILFFGLLCVVAPHLMRPLALFRRMHTTSAPGNYRDLMRKATASQVVVITAVSPNSQIKLRATTLSSFSSISLQPQIISFCLMMPSGMDAHLRGCTHCTVNFLTSNQSDVADLFARPRRAEEQQKVLNANWTSRTANMPPALPDTLGHFRCRLLTDLTKIIGDHSVWFCAVESTAVGLCDDKTSPLVYWQQKYCRL